MQNDLISRKPLVDMLQGVEDNIFAEATREVSPTKAFVAGVVQEIKNQVIDLPAVEAVPVVRCKECKNGAPLPEEARAEFTPGVMRCLAGRGDCDRYCTTWEDGFCDDGAKEE